MSGNLFEDRNWLLPKDYMAAENKKEVTTINTTKPPLKEEPKLEEQATSQKEEKCGWVPDCPFCKSQKKEGETNSNRNPYQSHKLEDLIPWVWLKWDNSRKQKWRG